MAVEWTGTVRATQCRVTSAGRPPASARARLSAADSWCSPRAESEGHQLRRRERHGPALPLPVTASLTAKQNLRPRFVTVTGPVTNGDVRVTTRAAPRPVPSIPVLAPGVDRHRHAPRPVVVVHRAGRIDARVPAEDVLQGEHDVSRADAEQRPQQASRTRARTAAAPGRQLPAHGRQRRARDTPALVRRSAHHSRHRLGVVRARQRHRALRIRARVDQRLARLFQSRSQRITLKPGTPRRASDQRTKSGTVPRSSAMTSTPLAR